MQIVTKYNREDIVWIMRRESPTQMRVCNITVTISHYGVTINYELRKLGFWGQRDIYHESLLFPTKEYLLKSL